MLSVSESMATELYKAETQLPLLFFLGKVASCNSTATGSHH